MKIRTAHPSDLPAFSALWELAFQDGPEVSRFVFEKLVHPEHVYLAEEDGRLLAILSAVPGQVEDARGSYFYGLATQPEAQGCGLMTQLMDHVCGLLRDQGQKFVCLVPASESLFGYYAQRGFETAFYRLTGTYSHELEQIPNFISKPFAPGQRLAPVQFCFDPVAERAMISSLGAIQICTQSGYGVFMPVEEKWFCLELTHPEVLDCALALWNVPEIHLRCPALPALEGVGTKIPHGMIRVLDPQFTWETLYLSLDGSL
ncbi:MAG: GNAT family N-acetyltransferase [Oscillospiraceae bacterium]|nr:GNAT family N-acetyltransferase [Oscillospiraceae bacterium]